MSYLKTYKYLRPLFAEKMQSTIKFGHHSKTVLSISVIYNKKATD